MNNENPMNGELPLESEKTAPGPKKPAAKRADRKATKGAPAPSAPTLPTPKAKARAVTREGNELRITLEDEHVRLLETAAREVYRTSVDELVAQELAGFPIDRLASVVADHHAHQERARLEFLARLAER